MASTPERGDAVSDDLGRALSADVEVLRNHPVGGRRPPVGGGAPAGVPCSERNKVRAGEGVLVTFGAAGLVVRNNRRSGGRQVVTNDQMAVAEIGLRSGVGNLARLMESAT